MLVDVYVVIRLTWGDVSTSLVITLTLGFSAFITVPTPEERAPPPYGTITASTSGRSSNISRATVPLPEEKENDQMKYNEDENNK